MNKKKLAATILGLAGLCSPASAGEWQTSCGTSRHALQDCTVRKGDVVLYGNVGYSHTFIMPNGKKYQWFYPANSSNTLCNYSDNFLKTPGGSWFPVYPQCISGGLISFQLPSGNIAFFASAY